MMSWMGMVRKDTKYLKLQDIADLEISIWVFNVKR